MIHSTPFPRFEVVPTTLLVPTPVSEVPAIWPQIRTHIVRALTKGDGWWTEQELRERAELGQVAVWQIKDGDRIIGVCMAEIEDWPSGKRVATVSCLCTDDGSTIDRHLAEVEAWARMKAAHELQIRGREGWKRRMKPYGYELCMVTLRKAL